MKKFFLLIITSLILAGASLSAQEKVDITKSKNEDSVIYSKLSAEQIYRLEKAKIEASEPKVHFGQAPALMFAPLITGTFIVLIVFIFIYLNNKKRYEIFLKYAENGKDIPLELLQPKKEKRSNLKKGLLLLFAGIGVIAFFLILVPEKPVWSIGLVLVSIGTGYLIVYRLESKTGKDELPG